MSFMISVNGRRVCTAGVGEHGVLNASVGWISVPEEERIEHSKEWRTGRVRLYVGGMRESVYLSWLPQGETLNPGDRVTIEIVKMDTVDSPAEQIESADPEVARQNRYECYKVYRKEFSSLADTDLPLPPDSDKAKALRRALYEEYKKEFER